MSNPQTAKYLQLFNFLFLIPYDVFFLIFLERKQLAHVCESLPFTNVLVLAHVCLVAHACESLPFTSVGAC